MASAGAMLREARAFLAELDELERAASETVTVYHAADFITGSINPTFARAVTVDADTNRVVVLGVVTKSNDETYPGFVARAKADADELRAQRLVFGGISPRCPKPTV